MEQNLSYYFTLSEEQAVTDLLAALQWDSALSSVVHSYAVDLIERIRKTRRKTGSLESFFQEYGLTTKEGLSLMYLAEALLRIPDSKTAHSLIKDKVTGTNWIKTAMQGDKDWLTKAAGLGLKLSSSTTNSLFSKLGDPLIREAMNKAMRLLGKQFVIGDTLESSLKASEKWQEKGFSFSYDILGEGARTASQAEQYFQSYHKALLDLSALHVQNKAEKVGMSVKLSALHPSYSYAHRAESIPAIIEKLMSLCEVATDNDMDLIVDAEEVNRLIPSLQIIETIIAHPKFKGWEGFGVAVQAYQKAAPHVIDYLLDCAKAHNRKIKIRLVKGAYWDTEIKLAQLGGHADYPVYTRKSNTDLSYLRCAQKLLRNRDVVYPLFGTHNAHTVSAIIKMANGKIDGFGFQKLFGMGDALYAQVIQDYQIKVDVYAPVGPFNDLLPYLVRRMLENGANSSFVNQIYNADYRVEQIAIDPVHKARNNHPKYSPHIPLPVDIFANRDNAQGLDFYSPQEIEPFLQSVHKHYMSKSYKAYPLIAGKKETGKAALTMTSPADNKDIVGSVSYASLTQLDAIFSAACDGLRIWSQTSCERRAQILETIADSLYEHKEELVALCVREGGRTLKDAYDEIREAIDFCRYYAAHGRRDFVEEGRLLKSATGESNMYRLEPRGIFICISPWNFPIAIYLGQIVAALMAGNAVIAKPAEQTCLIGFYLTQLMHKAGVPPHALIFVPGDGEIGAGLVDHPDVAGVAFTGSTEVARLINRSLAAKDGAIAKLIAETGGQNVMIVDSSALTEQVIDDVLLSAFGSAGQRCSACRILLVQEDVYDKTISMLQGAMREKKIGHPSQLDTDIGPLIDSEAVMNLQAHKTRLQGFGDEIAQMPIDEALKLKGNYFAPIAYRIKDLGFLEKEVFGPALHILSYKTEDIDKMIEEINAMGYGLTFGVHSRIQSFIDKLSSRIQAGNIYVNRGTIGAVVGVQPFGGRGLSGTGPKAGGPLYLHAFATEKVISTNTTAAGGNTSLVMLKDE